MDNTSNRTQGIMLSFINMIVSLIIGLIYTPFVLRLLGKNEYGVYSLATSLIGYLSVLDLGFGNALVRYTACARAEGKEEKNINGMFLIFYFIVSVVTLVIGFILLINIDNFFLGSFSVYEIIELKRIFFVLLINTVISFPTSVFSAIIRSHEKFIFANTLNLCQNILSHVVIICFLFIGFKSFMMAMVSLCFNICVAAINIFYCFSILRVKIGFKKLDKSFYREVFIYSFFVLINIIVDQLYANTDNVILGKFCGSVAVAVYGIGVTFQVYFQQLSVCISSVFLPYISQLTTENHADKKISDIFIRVGRVQTILLLYILTGFFIFGREFIRLWAGEGYEESYLIALIIMVPAVIPLSQNIGISVLQALNKHAIRSIMYLIISVINVVISIPLAIKLGGIGASIGTAIGNLLGQVLFMNWFYYKKIGLDIPQYWRQICVVVVKLIPVGIVFWVTYIIIGGNSWFQWLIRIFLGILVSIPYCFKFILNDDEKNFIKFIFRKV